MNLFYPLRFDCAQAPVTLRHFQVSGADAESFLHGQTTADVERLALGHFNTQALVDRTGKVEAHFYLLRTERGLEILAPVAVASVIQQRFEKFVISEDAELQDRGEVTWWLCLGPATPATGTLGTLGGERAAFSPTKFSAAEIDRAMIDRFLQWQGAPALDRAYHTQELINQTRLFDAAVDMTKGCFPGQETVAKIHHNRGAAWAPVLLQVTPAGQALAADIFIEDRKVARILTQDVSADGHWCTAEVLRDVRVEGLKLQPYAGVALRVVPYPRFPTDTQQKAQQLFYDGTMAFQREDAETALALWEKAVELAPAYADPYEAIGVLLGRQSKFDEAIAWMNKLLAVDPQSVMAHTNLSLFLMKQGKIKEAEDHKSLATVASFASYGRQAQEKEATEAAEKKATVEREQRERMFREVLEIDPEDALANYGLGSLSLERGEYETARDYFDMVLKSDANYSVAYLGLGKTLLKLGDKQRAQEILTQGVRVAAKKGEMMPANEMQDLLGQLA